MDIRLAVEVDDKTNSPVRRVLGNARLAAKAEDDAQDGR
jgi:hypothetical protein